MWAVGTLVYELALKEYPYPGYPGSVTHNDVVAPADLPPLPSEYPEEFRALVARMLCVDPTFRATPVEALSVLATLQTQSSVAAGAAEAAGAAAPSLATHASASSAPAALDSAAASAVSPAADASTGAGIGTGADTAAAAAPGSLRGPGSVAAASEETRTVFVKTVFGASTSVSLPSAATFAEVVRSAVAMLFPNRDPALFKVLYNGKLLDNAASIADVAGESCLFLVEPSAAAAAPAAAAAAADTAASGSSVASDSKFDGVVGDAGLDDAAPPAGSGRAPWGGAADVYAPALGTGSSAAAGDDAGDAPGEDAGGAPGDSANAFLGFYRFNETARNPNLELSAHGQVAECSHVWSSVFVNHPPVSSGKLMFSVRIVSAEQGCGAAIGVAVPSAFDPAVHNLGAHDMSWAYSKTGKIGRGHGFQPYADSFYTGDTVSVEADMDAGTLRFIKNGVDLGVAFHDLRGSTVVPAVCLGSNAGGNLTRVRLVTPSVRVFDDLRCNSRITLQEDGTAAWTDSKWATCLMAHNGIAEGVVAWSVCVDSAEPGAGVAVGVADPTEFDFHSQNLGVSPGSWCYSKTGNSSDGVSGMRPYGVAYGQGDVVTVVLDADMGTLRFEVNGEDQGIAASSGLAGRPLVPAVCLGSSSGHRQARVSIRRPVPPIIRQVRTFDVDQRNARVSLHKSNRVATNKGKWASVMLDHPGATRGILVFAVTVLEDSRAGGIGVGFADAASFQASTMSLGAVANSWCYSKTGKKSSGVSGFEPYGEDFKVGDTITAEVDLDRDMARFWVNGVPQGVAFEGVFAGRRIVPGVVMGSVEGGLSCSVRAAVPCVTQLDPNFTHHRMALENWGMMARCSSKWCTAVTAHPGVWEGERFQFACRVSGASLGGRLFWCFVYSCLPLVSCCVVLRRVAACCGVLRRVACS